MEKEQDLHEEMGKLEEAMKTLPPETLAHIDYLANMLLANPHKIVQALLVTLRQACQQLAEHEQRPDHQVMADLLIQTSKTLLDYDGPENMLFGFALLQAAFNFMAQEVQQPV